jgi:hypothetical protein
VNFFDVINIHQKPPNGPLEDIKKINVPEWNLSASINSSDSMTITRYSLPLNPYSFNKNTVMLLGPWAPITKDCSISAVLDGPAIKTP